MEYNKFATESVEVPPSPEKYVPEPPTTGYTKITQVQVSQDTINKQSVKLVRYKRTFRVVYTVLLILSIGIIWISLVGPLAVGFLSRPSLQNLTRTSVETLNNSLSRNPGFLPSKCVANGTNTSSNYSISCPEDYVFNCTMCVPICGLWHPSGESYYIGYRVTTILAAVIDLIFSLFGLIILIKVPSTFKFPQINYLFMFINAVVFSLILTAAALPGPYLFFCEQRKEDYAIVAADPSLHITIIGVIAQLSYFSFNLWFLCAVLNVFFIVYFPSWQILQSRKNKLILFVIESCISFGIPPLFPIIYLAIYREYTFVRLPQIPFTTDQIALLIFVVFPLLTITAISLTLIVLTIYKLQLQKLVVMGTRQRIQLRPFEIRLVIFAICLGVVVFVVFLEASFDVRNNKIVQFYLEEFWSCLTLKNNPNLFEISNLTCVKTYQTFLYPAFTIIGDLGLGIWSILLLIILTTKETRNAWEMLFKKICRNPARAIFMHSKGNTSVVKLESLNTRDEKDVNM